MKKSLIFTMLLMFCFSPASSYAFKVPQCSTKSLLSESDVIASVIFKSFDKVGEEISPDSANILDKYRANVIVKNMIFGKEGENKLSFYFLKNKKTLNFFYKKNGKALVFLKRLEDGSLAEVDRLCGIVPFRNGKYDTLYIDLPSDYTKDQFDSNFENWVMNNKLKNTK